MLTVVCDIRYKLLFILSDYMLMLLNFKRNSQTPSRLLAAFFPRKTRENNTIREVP